MVMFGFDQLVLMPAGTEDQLMLIDEGELPMV